MIEESVVIFMKSGLTEMVFILDKSGSMAGLEKDTIGGYNAMLKEQQNIAGQCIITTVLFSSTYDIIHDRQDIQGVAAVTESNYRVGGGTALLDAIGDSIEKIKNSQKNTKPQYQAEKVMFVIITDGEENSSRKYSSDEIKSKIQHQKDKYNWEFIFLGANIDAVETAGKFGIPAERAQNFHSDQQGVEISYQVLSEAATSLRMSDEIMPDWNKEISKDFKKSRKK